MSSPRSYCLFSLLFLCANVAHASELIEKVQHAYQQTDQFQADFIQKTKIEVLDREVTEKGHMIFAKPGHFRIHYEGDRERVYVSDGKTLWISHPKEKEVETYKNQDILAKEALVFLGGLGEMTKEFRVSENNGLVLIPKSKQSPFTKIILTIDPKTSLVRGATLFPKSGNFSHYDFSHIQTLELPQTTFKRPS